MLDNTALSNGFGSLLKKLQENNIETTQEELSCLFFDTLNTSNATSITTAQTTSANSFSSSASSASSSLCAKFLSKTTLSVFIASTSYGFMDGVDYEYHIIYSS